MSGFLAQKLNTSLFTNNTGIISILESQYLPRILVLQFLYFVHRDSFNIRAKRVEVSLLFDVTSKSIVAKYSSIWKCILDH